MKIITLRIDEEEKARLEQLAERGNVTLSRALREGAGLYLGDIQAKAHRKRGGDVTFHGIRRDQSGRPVGERTAPTATERTRLTSLRNYLYDNALVPLRDAWDEGADVLLVLPATGHWLSLVGRVYVGSGDETGWYWFLRDYCGYLDEEAPAVQRMLRGAFSPAAHGDVSALLDRLDAGFRRFLKDAENQQLVRRAVLPTWHVLERSL